MLIATKSIIFEARRTSATDTLSCGIANCEQVRVDARRMVDHMKKDHGFSAIKCNTFELSGSTQPTEASSETSTTTSSRASSPTRDSMASSSSLSARPQTPSHSSLHRQAFPRTTTRNHPYSRPGSRESSPHESPVGEQPRTLSEVPSFNDSPNPFSTTRPIPDYPQQYQLRPPPTPIRRSQQFSSQSSGVQNSADVGMSIDLRSPEDVRPVETRQSPPSISLLRSAALRVLDFPVLLACSECMSGVPPQKAVKHAKGHGVKLTRNEWASIDEELLRVQLPSNDDEVANFAPTTAPIVGLSIEEGFSCPSCVYCCLSEATMIKHWSISHRDDHTPAKVAIRAVHIQALFAMLGDSRWFKVNPSLAGLSADDPFSVYLNANVPEFEVLTSVNLPTDEGEITPLVKMMGWMDYLGPYCDDIRKVNHILDLLHLPTGRDKVSWLGKPLADLTERYVDQIRVKTRNAKFDVRVILMECPRQVYCFSHRLQALICSIGLRSTRISGNR